MEKGIFIGKKTSAGKEGCWRSFESDPHLKETKRKIYDRCVPCMEWLHTQLKEGKKEIHLGEAYDCWKVIAVVNTEEECLELLKEYEERFLSSKDVRGRFGTSDESIPTRVVIFNAESEAERDRLLREVEQCVMEVYPVRCLSNGVNLKPRVFYQRACANLYYPLLGPWQNWQRIETLLHPEFVPQIIERIRKLLYPTAEE